MALGNSPMRLEAVYAGVDSNRPARTPIQAPPLTPAEWFFAGNLIDPETGTIGSGRTAREAAGAVDPHLHRPALTVNRGARAG